MLFDDNTFLLPGKTGRNKEIDIKAAVFSARVNAFSIFHMILHTGTDTAGEGIEPVAVYLMAAHTKGDIITHHAVIMILRGQYMIVERLLIIIHQSRGRMPGEKVPRQLEHIV